MLNIVTLQGRLTADPELKYTNNNTPVLNFSVAVEENRIANGERKTNFFKCVAWKKCAEFISTYFEKGKPIIITGELSNNAYTDKNGNKQMNTFVIVSSVYFCGAKSAASQEKDFDAVINDDLPFADEEG